MGLSELMLVILESLGCAKYFKGVALHLLKMSCNNMCNHLQAKNKPLLPIASLARLGLFFFPLGGPDQPDHNSCRRSR